MAELKHVGRIISTKQRCLVAYRTLPGDSHFCLVIPTDSLSDAYHNSIINLVETQAAQDSYEFAEVLMRNYFSDGNNMLKWLHSNGLLLKMATSSIEMCPTTSITVQLSELNQIIAEQNGVSLDELALTNWITPNPKTVKPVEPIKEESTDNLSPTELRSRADALFKQAQQLRKKADEVDPPKSKKKASVVVETE